MDVIDRIKELKGNFDEKHNKTVSMASFSRFCGIHVNTMNGYTKRKSTPDRDRAQMIAEANGVNLVWLLTGEGPKYKETAQVAATDNSAAAGGDQNGVIVAGHGARVETSTTTKPWDPADAYTEDGFSDEVLMYLFPKHRRALLQKCIEQLQRLAAV